MSMLHQNSGVIGKSTPSALEIYLHPQDFPREIFRVSGNLLGIRDGFPNTSLVLMEDGPILSLSIFLQGVDQEILPCRQGRID